MQPLSVDINLQTNRENPSLAFRALERFDNGSGYCTRLAVRSGWIYAEYDFFFEAHALARFLKDLEQIDHTLTGVARLKPAYEAQFVEFRGDGKGHVLIKGELMEHGQMEQRVEFAFETDQTCLRPLIAAFHQLAS
jgi:hypothetical protein